LEDENKYDNESNFEDKPPKKLYRNFSRRPRKINPPKGPFQACINLDERKFKKRKLCQMSLDEKAEIVHKVLI
jgi:hypothetical protein